MGGRLRSLTFVAFCVLAAACGGGSSSGGEGATSTAPHAPAAIELSGTVGEVDAAAVAGWVSAAAVNLPPIDLFAFGTTSRAIVGGPSRIDESGAFRLVIPVGEEGVLKVAIAL